MFISYVQMQKAQHHDVEVWWLESRCGVRRLPAGYLGFWVVTWRLHIA